MFLRTGQERKTYTIVQYAPDAIGNADKYQQPKKNGDLGEPFSTRGSAQSRSQI